MIDLSYKKPAARQCWKPEEVVVAIIAIVVWTAIAVLFLSM